MERDNLPDRRRGTVAVGQTVVTLGPIAKVVVGGVLTALVLTILSAAYSNKEDRSSHDADVASIRAEARLRSAVDSARWAQSERLQQTTLDEVRALGTRGRR